LTKVILAAPSEETPERGVRNEPFIYFREVRAGAFEKPLTLFEEYGFRLVSTVIQDDRLHWADAPWIRDGWIYPPEAQIDRIGQFHQGHSQVTWPLHIYRAKLSQNPWHLVK